MSNGEKVENPKYLKKSIEKLKKLQETLVQIKHRYGKNAILKGMNALDFATAKKRNTLIGGHNAY